MKKVVLILAILHFGFSMAQSSDEIGFEQGLFSGSNVATINKTKFVVGFPLLKTDSYSLSLGGDYQATNIEYVDADVPFTTEMIEHFNMFSGSLKFAHALPDNWSVVLTGEGQISSNFENDMGGDDVFYNGSLIFRNTDVENNSIWKIGVIYDHQYGIDTPIPWVTYSKQVTEKFGYQLGIPEMYATYNVGQSHQFTAFAKLDGFMGSFNDEMEVKVSDFEDTGILRQTSVVSGLGYQFNFLGNFSLNIDAGFSLYNNMTVEDYDGNEIYDFDYNNGFYGTIGVKYRFNNKLLD
ncbi:MAG: hypothetical protein CMH46_19790 [Muricauda sp.]|nr:MULTISPECIES: DUF6268 family outer membrane beta-barrel protein [unclassified Allomuricauda]MAU17774.1 hypothetical protein [Allomuricauda sp.]|tara:strand:+ start:25454 stop:26335 length:882 start_codon:yes stop_codon:yes gene_type:complete